MIRDIYYLFTILTYQSYYARIALSDKMYISTHQHTNLCATFKLIFIFQLFLHQSDNLRSLIIPQWNCNWENQAMFQLT